MRPGAGVFIEARYVWHKYTTERRVMLRSCGLNARLVQKCGGEYFEGDEGIFIGNKDD